MAGDEEAAAAAALKEAQEAKAQLARTEATVKTLQDEMKALREQRTVASSYDWCQDHHRGAGTGAKDDLC